MARDHRVRREPPTPVGSTAHWIAAVRARESARPDRLFDDPYAAALAGELGLQVMQASEKAGGGRNEFIPVRVRWFDDLVEGQAAAGIRQVVLLGAGLDTRAYRLDLPAGLRWYELDQPEVLQRKEPVLRRAVPRCERVVLPVDLAGDWLPALLGTGFEVGAATLWLAEGLLVYLGEDDVLRLLRTAAGHCGPGSRFAADVFGATALRARVHSSVIRFGSDDPAGLLQDGGWRPERVDVVGSPAANYGRLTGSVRVPGGFLVVGAR